MIRKIEVRLFGYLVFCSAAAWVGYVTGSSDYYHQYSQVDGDADLGIIRGIGWGFFAFIAGAVFFVVAEVVGRRVGRTRTQ